MVSGPRTFEEREQREREEERERRETERETERDREQERREKTAGRKGKRKREKERERERGRTREEERDGGSTEMSEKTLLLVFCVFLCFLFYERKSFVFVFFWPFFVCLFSCFIIFLL